MLVIDLSGGGWNDQCKVMRNVLYRSTLYKL